MCVPRHPLKSSTDTRVSSYLGILVLLLLAATSAAGRDLSSSNDGYSYGSGSAAGNYSPSNQQPSTCHYDDSVTESGEWLEGPTLTCYCDDDGEWKQCYSNPTPAARQEPVWPSPSCPSGYAYSADDKICQKTSKASPQPYCESSDYILTLLAGYSNKKVCKKTDYKDVAYNCPASYQLKVYGDERKCEKIVYKDYWLSCPYEGYSLVDVWTGKKCAYEKTAEPKWKCPSGYAWKGGKCQKTEEAEVEWKCEYGWTLEWVPSYKAHMCTWGNSAPKWPSPSCPSGYAYSANDKVCRQTKKADAVPYCESSDYTLTDHPKICKHTDYKDVAYNCPASYQLKAYGDDRKCEKIAYADYWLSCPYEGYSVADVPTGKKCAYEATAEPKWACPSGYSWKDGDCQKTEKAEVEWKCEYGWTLEWVPSYNAHMCTKN